MKTWNSPNKGRTDRSAGQGHELSRHDQVADWLSRISAERRRRKVERELAQAGSAVVVMPVSSSALVGGDERARR